MHVRATAAAHVEACPSCADLLDSDDAAERVLFRLARERRRIARPVAGALAVLASAQVVMAAPWFFGSNPFGFLDHHVATDHLTRDGAFGLLVGVAGLVTAWRQRYALAMFILCVATLALQALAFVVDSTHDRVHALFEMSHVLALAVMLLVGACAFWPSAVPRPPRLAKAQRLDD